MARGLRLGIPDGVYHVTNRGVDRIYAVSAGFFATRPDESDYYG